MKNDVLLKILEKYWAQQGDCCSCGWHALIHEHNWEDADVDEGRRRITLNCVSKNVDDPETHRGVRIDYQEEDLKDTGEAKP